MYPVTVTFDNSCRFGIACMNVKSSDISMIFRSQNKRTCTGQQQTEEDYFEMEQNLSSVTNAGASTSTGITHENYERKIVKSTEKVPKWFKP
ncbi:hypothetical protein NQ314_007171 [Rhamnusium bicolor]|uniref:Uncharacterized protein n=1 Tax=Rhamnusium bicolor TaxID=1586634 RepID=A0AAV8YRH8_9CUCU|nr:hypothetical protein NQ314_007171 [Rhamnusium bicolor]